MIYYSNMINNFCSQYRDIKDEDWKNKACTICALYMALKFLKDDFDLSVDDLLIEALKIKAWSDTGFWIHNKIAILAHNYGLPAYTEEFKSIPFGVETKYAEDILDYGIKKIFNFLKNKEGLIIISAPKNWMEIDKPHSILLIDILEENEEKYFIYNDSAKENEAEGRNLKINLKDFKNTWRKLAIFINKI